MLNNYHKFVIIHIGIITMRFNKTTEYALRVFAYMANNRTKLYRADEIHNHLGIPPRYLKRLLTQLSKTDLLVSVQGNKGGYLLKKDSGEITLYEIIKATENSNEKNRCFFGFKECQFGKKCHMHNKWVTISESIENLLKSTSLSDLTDRETQEYITDNLQLLTK